MLTHQILYHYTYLLLRKLCKNAIQQQLLSVLIPTLKDPRIQVHSYATTVLLNFCEDIEHDTLISYLNFIIQELLCFLNPTSDRLQIYGYCYEIFEH